MPVMPSDREVYGDAYIGVYIEPQIRAALDVMAKRNRRSRSDEVRAAIAKHVVSAPKPTAPLRRP